MRIKVDYYIKKLPIIYRNRFMALIKDSLEKSDKFYKERLYPDKESEISKIKKPFCFSLFLPPSRKSIKELILIDNNFEVEDIVFYFPENSYLSFLISSSDAEFMINLYNGLLDNKTFQFSDGIILYLKNTNMLQEKTIKNDNVCFKTLSPILIETKDERPILPTDGNLSDFNNEFYAIHDRILKDVRGYGLNRKLVFEPLRIKKQVVKHTLRGFREKTGKPYMTLTCFEGAFKINGDPEDLQMLYQIGIGLRTGQGFGMVEVVEFFNT